MCLFEGNGLILNLYSEVDKPNQFFRQISIVLVTITALGILVGSLSYVAYRDQTNSIIMYNLSGDALGLSIKILYMVTIMGIYVLVIMPVFSLVEKYHWYNQT